MGLFEKLFGHTGKDRIYLAGWEVFFNGDEKCQRFLETQVVDEETAMCNNSSLELIFYDKKLSRVFEITDGEKEVRKLKWKEKKLPFQELVPHVIFDLCESEFSESYLGGKPPEEFNTPKIEGAFSFQYIGKFSNKTEVFSWLPFDLHLVAPLYLDYLHLFIDYSDPMNPRILDENEFCEMESPFYEVHHDSQISFKKVYVEGNETSEFPHLTGHTGVPNWIQSPDIPVCPISGKLMQFVAEITSENNVKTASTNIVPTDKFYEKYFENLNFGGSGDLYIFFQPESKVLHIFDQFT